jgi:1,4-dihydroxy-2-naphthoate octaprenyltransferase
MTFPVELFFIRLAKPLTILGGVLFYALGVGISHYLGNPIDWGLVFLGQIWVTTYQLGSHFLTAFFHLPSNQGDKSKLRISSDGDENPKFIRRDLILSAAFTAYGAAAMLAFLTLRTKEVSGVAFVIMFLMTLGAVSFAVPPFQLVKSGYGELVQSITMANLIPGLAFVLQTGEIHRLVAMSTFPLTLLHVSSVLALQFPEYAFNLRRENTTLLTRLGWERGMLLHNILILSSFLLFGLAMLFGLSMRVTLPIFFVLPLGLFQIWYMVRIASGIKPNWRLLRFTAILTFGLSTYLIAFSYWIR